MEECNFEQRHAVKFGEIGIEIFSKLKQAYGKHDLSRSQVFKWYKAFSEGHESIKDEPCSGRPSTSKTDNNVEKVRALVRSDHRLTVRMIASELNFKHTTTVHQILTNE
jgi:transposase-like protein